MVAEDQIILLAETYIRGLGFNIFYRIRKCGGRKVI